MRSYRISRIWQLIATERQIHRQERIFPKCSNSQQLLALGHLLSISSWTISLSSLISIIITMQQSQLLQTKPITLMTRRSIVVWCQLTIILHRELALHNNGCKTRIIYRKLCLTLIVQQTQGWREEHLMTIIKISKRRSCKNWWPLRIWWLNSRKIIML